MRVYSVEKVVSPEGTIQLEALPFAAGETVEILVLSQKPVIPEESKPLKDSVLSFEDPLEPVVETDWSALQCS